MGHHLLAALAGYTRNATGQRVLAEHPEYHPALATNSHLVDDVFATIYPSSKTKAELARQAIANGVLTDAKFDHVLAVETRHTVLSQILHHGLPDPARLERLLEAKAFKRRVADQIVDTYGHVLTTEWLAAAAEKVGGKAQLEVWLRDPESISDDDLSAKLQVYSTWATTQKGRIPQAKDQLRWLLATRPGAIAGAARSDDSRVRTAAAGSRHLTERDDQLAVLGITSLDDKPDRTWEQNPWLLLALANNPVVANDVVAWCDDALVYSPEYNHIGSGKRRLNSHPDPVRKPYEAEDDPQKLAWLVRRCSPSESRPGRQEDLLALLDNPHLGESEVLRIHIGCRRTEDPLHPSLVAKVNELLPTFPETADETPLRAEPEPQVQPYTPDDPEPWEEINPTYGDAPVSGLMYGGNPLVYLDTHLGDDPEVWRTAMALLPNLDKATAAELVSVAQATAA